MENMLNEIAKTYRKNIIDFAIVKNRIKLFK